MSTVCTFYAGDGISFLNLRFENDVKMYGTQTVLAFVLVEFTFENDVKMYGTQTKLPKSFFSILFENDVKMYGTQTTFYTNYKEKGLRMM